MTDKHQNRLPCTTNECATHRTVAGIPVHVVKALSKLILDTLTSSRQGVDNGLSTAMKALVLHKVRKGFNSPDFVLQFLNAINDSQGLIKRVAALVRSKQCELAA